MNKVILSGRLTKDVELKQTQSGLSNCTFTVAVNRNFTDQSGQRQADFINCQAWRKPAEAIAKYFHKGSRISLVGRIQTRSYDDQNGQKHYITEVMVEEFEFVDTKAESAQAGQTAPQEIIPIPPMPAENATAQMPTASPDDAQSLPFDLSSTFNF